MYGISCEDRLWLVKRDQEARRADAAGERLARAASEASTADVSGAASADDSGVDRAWMTARHVLSAITGGHGVARDGVVR